MTDFTRIKKLLGQSTTMPYGTGQAQQAPSEAMFGKGSKTLTGMQAARGSSCSCCSGGHHDDADDEAE